MPRNDQSRHNSRTTHDVVVIGAGIAGLGCARDLAAAGARCLVVERSRGVGGRCATRRVKGTVVDHGVPFLHGRDEDFIEALSSARPAELLDPWPREVVGGGRACQPKAFESGERRVAFACGVTAFPKALAEGLDVVRGSRVVELGTAARRIAVECADGSRYEAADVVLAVPLPQAAALLAGLEAHGEGIPAARFLASQIAVVPCLTVLAGYPEGAPAPEWDLMLPDDGDAIQTVSHDSAKRRSARATVLVLQAAPGWSGRRLQRPPEAWARAMLEEAGRRIGDWAAAPAWFETHRWRFARSDGSGELRRPLVLCLHPHGTIGIVGETFAPGGGIQAAWRSGRLMAARIVAGGRAGGRETE